MNTAIAITSIIAATLLINSAIVAARDAAKAKHAVCKICERDKNKENGA